MHRRVAAGCCVHAEKKRVTSGEFTTHKSDPNWSLASADVLGDVVTNVTRQQQQQSSVARLKGGRILAPFFCFWAIKSSACYANEMISLG